MRGGRDGAGPRGGRDGAGPRAGRNWAGPRAGRDGAHLRAPARGLLEGILASSLPQRVWAAAGGRKRARCPNRRDDEGGSTRDMGQWPRKVARAVGGNRREGIASSPDSGSWDAGPRAPGALTF